jgi:propionyl-CoA synthetase
VKYREVYEQSIKEPETFWGKAAEALKWEKRWETVLDRSKAPFYRWFVGGEINTCYNCVDYHVEEGRGSQTAIIYDSPVTNTIRRITYEELLDKVSTFAGVLKGIGVEKGDRVVIYMPMIPESLVAMLACARIGAVHSVVFGGFAPQELAKRINDAQPKIVVTASCGIEAKKVIPYKPMLDKAIELADHKPQRCVVYQRPQVHADLLSGRDSDWDDLCKTAPNAPCVSVAATDPLYILYTSGTTGTPKGVVRDNGGYLTALQWSMKYFYDIKPGEVFWAASDVGWVVGHSYIVYAPLLAGCITIVYEGKPVGTPDPGAFWRVISEHKVSVFFTAPTAIRALKREDPKGEFLRKYDTSPLRYLFLAGERLDPDTYYWARELLKVPVIDHWWQTETGWAIAGNCMGIEQLPVKAGSPTKPVPGYDVRIIDDIGNPVAFPREGLVGIKLPLPPGCLPTLWNNDERYLEYVETVPGYYITGDSGYTDEDGYLFIMGRADEVINVAGHRLSTGGIEEIVARHPDVAECAVIGAADQLKGQVPIGFVVLKAGSTKDQDLICQELVQMVRADLGAVACFQQCVIVGALPKTRSGKILRKTMQRIADGRPFDVPSTIEDASALGCIEDAAKKIGFGKKE